jgi:hypothetical protein
MIMGAALIDVSLILFRVSTRQATGAKPVGRKTGSVNMHARRLGRVLGHRRRGYRLAGIIGPSATSVRGAAGVRVRDSEQISVGMVGRIPFHPRLCDRHPLVRSGSDPTIGLMAATVLLVSTAEPATCSRTAPRDGGSA